MQNKKFFVITLIYYISLATLSVVFLLSYLDILNNKFISTFLIQIVVMTAIPIFMYTLLVTKKPKQTLKDFGFKKIGLNVILLSFVLGIILYILNVFVSSVFQTFIQALGYDNIFVANSKVTKSFLTDFALVAVLPAICEEILHRGLLFGGIKNTGNPRFALVLSSLCFGLMHLNISQFFYAALLGGLIGFVAYVSDSIYPSMIMHFMNNFLSIFFLYGDKYKWPLANLKTEFIQFLASAHYVTSFFIIFTLICLLIMAFFAICSYIAKQRMQQKAEEIVKTLEIDKLPPEKAKEQLAMIDSILLKSGAQNFMNIGVKKVKYSFTDKIFMYSTIFMGSVLTLLSFVWGVL